MLLVLSEQVGWKGQEAEGMSQVSFFYETIYFSFYMKVLKDGLWFNIVSVHSINLSPFIYV